jgi:serine/threonine-protein kinase RsbW
MTDAVSASTVHRRLEHSSAAGSAARELVMDLLASHRTTDELRHDAALVAYELVANAVAHGRPDPDGTVELFCELVDDHLVVVVRDAGSHGSVRPKPLEPEAGRGRGLAIVDALTSSWSVDRSDGTVVTARVPLSLRAP